jgi:hypothetical protein
MLNKVLAVVTLSQSEWVGVSKLRPTMTEPWPSREGYSAAKSLFVFIIDMLIKVRKYTF